jgi:hypothetical protein
LIVSGDSKPKDFDRSRWATLDRSRFFAAWRGAIYEPDHEMGEPSVERLLGSLDSKPLSALIGTLRGVFVLVVLDKMRSVWTVSVDNSGLYHTFYDGNCVSTSLLELARAKGVGVPGVSSSRVAEFLAMRTVHGPETLIEGVKTIRRNEFVEIRSGQPLRVVRGDSTDRNATPVDLVKEFEYLALAVKGKHLSVDLTGGLDSRLAACLLRHHQAEFEAATSGRPDLPDVIIAKRAAKILNCQLYVADDNVSMIEGELENLFYARDALGDVLEFYRPGRMQAERASRGVEIAVSGGGGEFFKDFYWLQDFPRYRSRKTNFERLYDLRFAPVRLPPGLLIGEVADAHRRLRAETIHRFGELTASTNTASYDRVYFFYQMPAIAGAFLTNSINSHLPVLAPFLDYHSYLLGSSLPRHTRTFFAFHRKLITASCPELARMKTVTGVTAHTGMRYLAPDIVALGTRMLKLVVDKVAQRTMGRTIFWISADNPQLAGKAKSSQTFAESLNAVKRAGFVDRHITAADVPDSLVGRLLTIGMLVQHLEGTLSPPNLPTAPN